MTHNEIIRAYNAIQNHVQKHVTGDADDLFCACQNAFDRLKDGYDKDIGEIENFAAEIARTCLFDEGRAADTRKCREKAYTEFLNRHHGEKAEKKNICALVEKALKKLSPEDRGIIAWTLCGWEINLLTKIWGISERAFIKYHANPARQRFAEAFGEVVGNPKLYAKLRAEVLAKAKGQN